MDIDDLLFQPLLIRKDDLEYLIIVISIECSNVKFMDANGEVSKEDTYLISVIDVMTTLEEDRPYITHLTFKNLDEFRKITKKIDKTQAIGEIEVVRDILIDSLNIIYTQMKSLSSAASVVAKLCTPVNDDHVIMFGNKHAGLAHIVMKAIDGSTKKLTKEQIETIGKTLIDVVMANTESDLDDPEQIRKIKAEIEYKVIDSLPNNMKADDININMDTILKEIRSIQNFKEDDDDADTE